MEETLDLKLRASDETLHTVIHAIETRLEKAGCPEMIQTLILVAVEEIYVNIAHYAYGGQAGEALVHIDITENPEKCRVVFKDKGLPYNPLEKKDPDITLSAEERQIGGLGIYIVKQSMDKVEYEHKDGYNIMTIEKGFHSVSAAGTQTG